ncbi:MAG: LarC family nickel insertion protein [Lachnospiraceae bacterium]|nr:LarC family nickel insertion protein [Lachnospiraceae bacterium]
MGKKTLYLDTASGISGDMTVAALLDLGADREGLVKALKSLPLEGYDIKISSVKKAGIAAVDFDVILDKEHENHDHDMEYLYGHTGQEYGHDHGPLHDHDHAHHHFHHHDLDRDFDYPEHDHHHEHEHDHHHHHEHRGMKEITDIINGAGLSEEVKNLAKKIFDILAEAEAKAHGLPKDEVHFHEVGAVDSIVDIVAVAWCFDDLGITDCIVPVINDGTGSVRCQHGVMPVPVPAVVNIAEANGLRLHIMDVQGEFVTPTGAAFVAAVKTSDRLPESFIIKKTGYGAGKREHSLSGLLRALIIEE